MKTSVILFASKEVAAQSPSLSYPGRLAFWFNYFLRREVKLAKEINGLIKPYRPKVTIKKQLLLTGPAQLPPPPSEIRLSAGA